LRGGITGREVGSSFGFIGDNWKTSLGAELFCFQRLGQWLDKETHFLFIKFQIERRGLRSAEYGVWGGITQAKKW
jgi:hypothetical protein